MKRFLVLLLLLAVIGGTVFFFGWVQLQIPAGANGVIFTKTNGWEETVAQPGTFIWRWQRLIPTNLTLYIFPATDRTFTVRSSGSLPGAGSLAPLVDDTAVFRYSAQVSVSLQVQPSALPTLAREENLRPDSLDDYLNRIETQAVELATDAIDEVLQAPTDPAIRVAEVSQRVKEQLQSGYPNVDVLSVAVTELSLPDAAVYEEARTLLRQVMQARATALQAAAESLAEQQTSDAAQLTRLERYGEILDQYPVLLEYFRVSSEIGGNPLDIESLLDEPTE